MTTKPTSYIITGKAYEVYNELRYGLQESVYELALEWELKQAGLIVEREVSLPVYYKGHLLDKVYRIDLLVERNIIIELKAVECVFSEHRLQLFNYMRLMQLPYGMLINFGPDGVDVERYTYDKTSNKCTLVQRRKRSVVENKEQEMVVR